MENKKGKKNEGAQEHEQREAVIIPRCPGSLETAGFRKTTQDFGFSVAVAREHLQFLFPIQERINHYFVFMLVPVESKEQAEHLCRQNEDPEADTILLPSPEDNNPFKPECSVEFLAELFDCTTRYIQKLASTGVVYQLARGKYDTSKSIKGYIAHLRNIGKGNGTSAAAEERALLIRAQRETKELELRVRRGELLEVQDVQATRAGEYTNFEKTLQALPVKIARDIPFKYRAAVRDGAAVIINEALAELSGHQPEAKPVNKKKKPTKKKTSKTTKKKTAKKKTMKKKTRKT